MHKHVVVTSHGCKVNHHVVLSVFVQEDVGLRWNRGVGVYRM
jgi:hypothetical protein